MRRPRLLSWISCALIALAAMLPGALACAQNQLAMTSDMVLDPQALLMPRGSTYGPAINGVAYQTEALMTVGDYQYATWYHRTPGVNEFVYLGRRELGSSEWEVFDTGQTFDNGDGPAWNAHNVISMGIDGDGRVHLSYDHHNSHMNYRSTDAGAATAAVWNPVLNSEANTLNTNVAGTPPAPFDNVTYPRFYSAPDGNMKMVFRTGTSGDGQTFMATYDRTTETWTSPQMFINGRDGQSYSDPYGSSSNNRNAYLNGVDFDASGRMHSTWTWRESAGGTNHDIMYAYSDDGGSTWKNNDGVTVGTPGSPIQSNSAGVTVVSLDRGNTLMNQQTQVVDADGAVHTVMWHRRDEVSPFTGFDATRAGYFHYYRDPGKTLLADYFDGTGLALNGTTPSRTSSGTLWQAGGTYFDNGIASTTVAGTANGEAAHLDFTPEAGKVYTAEATLLNNQSNWMGFGFLPTDPASGDWTQTSFATRHSNAPGYAWMLSANRGGNDQEGFLGGGATGMQGWSGDVVDPTTPVDMKIVLDTREENWTVQWYLNGVSQGAPVAYEVAGNPGIGGIGFSHDRSSTANGGALLTNFSLKEGDSIGEWVRNELPTERAVGSRPDMGYDEFGNLYVAYVSPAAGDGAGVAANYYTNGDLVIATASKATGWQDWEIVYTDQRDFVGEPQMDRTRLLDSGVVSIYLQENGNNASSATGSSLHVLEFANLAQNLVWTGNSGNQWGESSLALWDSDGDDYGDAPFENGYRTTFDDGATTFDVAIAEPVNTSGMTFRHTTGQTFTFTGQGIGGGGGMRIVGGGAVELHNGASTFTGDTLIEKGELHLVGDASLASPRIVVTAGAMLSATVRTSGTLPLTTQTLELEGALSGNVAATMGSTIHVSPTSVLQGNVSLSDGSSLRGEGTIGGELHAAGSIVRVGGVGLTSTIADAVTVIDDFSDTLSGYTNTVILDSNNGGSNSAAWQTSNGEVYYQTLTRDGIGVEQSVLRRDGLALAVNEEIQVELDHTGAAQDVGLYVGGTTPTTGVRENYVAMYVRNDGSLYSRGFNGTSELSLQGAGTAAFDRLFIRRVGNTSFELGYYNGDTRTVVSTRNNLSGNDGDVVGFYTDVRGTGWLGALDNFTLVTPGVLVYQGQTLLVEGSMSLDSTSTLELDIATPTGSDQLVVESHFTAGGTLDVALAAGAPAPELGDAFELLTFESAAGAFDAYLLPSLASGLGWDTTQLLVSGVLSVGLAGDYNGDGAVNLADYTVWRDNLGTSWISNRDTQLVGLVGLEDYQIWKQNFGATLASSFANAAAVPEASSQVSLALALFAGGAVLSIARVHRLHGRVRGTVG
jgi:hypothetical protein